MNINVAPYAIPTLGVLCVVVAAGVVVAIRPPVKADFSFDEVAAYSPSVPESLQLDNRVPTMEDVVEKHLFVKERKASGENTFPNLLIKGVYVGTKKSAVLSLKSKPEINLRVWQDDVNDVIARITDPRDPRKPIADFLSEWDLREIGFEGVTVEHIVTGEVETYAVNYTPEKKVKDSAETGYGQGALTSAAKGGGAKTARAGRPAGQQAAAVNQQRAQAFRNLRELMENMSPEQRARFADRLRGDMQQDKKTPNKGPKNGGNTKGNGGSTKGNSSKKNNKQ